jgi:uncharacterized membrane protein
MSPFAVILLAFLIGVVGGLRAMTAPAVVAWAARLQWLHLDDTSLAFFGSTITVALFTLFAIAELIADQLPSAPSRKEPPGFIARLAVGALCGAAVATAGGQSLVIGGVAGLVGGAAGTLGGYEARTRLVRALGVPDFVIACLEDAVAIGGGLLIVSSL